MADETDDLEYSETNVSSAQTQGVRKNISLKLKGKSRGKGRRGGKTRRSSIKKASDVPDEEDGDGQADPIVDKKNTVKPFPDTNLDDVISKLETPAFSPMDRTFPEPLHQNKKLMWDHKVNLVGDKVIDPLIHCCEKCSLPILNYGRMIPCKHVACYDCAKKSEVKCIKCDENCQRMEQASLGTVFMCTFGGSRQVPGNCGRTYLSIRDLQAHINHRHTVKPVTSSSDSTTETSNSATHMPPGRDSHSHLQVDVSHHHLTDHRDPSDHRNPSIPLDSPRAYPHSPANYPSAIPTSSARPNLITVQIQDDGAAHSVSTVSHLHPPTHVPQYATAATPQHQPIPLQHPPASYPSHTYQAPLYSQAPPMASQTFGQPPPLVHHQPPIHPSSGPIFSAPPPVVHHPPAAYTPPQGPQRPLPPPQRFPLPAGSYDENPSYMPQWHQTSVPPPPTRSTLPPCPIPAPTANAHIPPRGPADPNYRPPYYQ